MEYTVAGGPRDSSDSPSKKVVLSSTLMERASGGGAPIGGGITIDALLSKWQLVGAVSLGGAISVKKLGAPARSVPGIILPSLKGSLEEAV
jgi:hypothetical protein